MFDNPYHCCLMTQRCDGLIYRRFGQPGDVPKQHPGAIIYSFQATRR
jgi:hypothetical protein